MDTKTLYLPAAENDVVWAAVITGSPWLLLAVWLAAINAVTFLIFGLDKWKARRKMRRASVRRIPEKTLFLLALLGGSVGALLGMRVFHHKTLHKSFRYGIPAIFILEAAAVLAAWIWLR